MKEFMPSSINKPLLTQAVDDLYILLTGVLNEQPDESGHPILNRYFRKTTVTGTHQIVRPGNIEVTLFPTEEPVTAHLVATMNPLVAQTVMNLLHHLKEEQNLTPETVEAADTLARELSYSINSSKLK
jgi:hypothetical protein